MEQLTKNQAVATSEHHQSEEPARHVRGALSELAGRSRVSLRASARWLSVAYSNYCQFGTIDISRRRTVSN